MSNSSLVAYLAAKGFAHDLIEEIRLNGIRVLECRERLVLADGYFPSAWAQNIWLEPFFMHVDSIGDAARKLKAIQRNWKLHPLGFFRRASLIEQALPPVKAKAIRFGTPAPSSPLGSWTLWDHDTILASAQCSSPFPDGEAHFEEDRISPPSRAYLKLWEVFTLTGIHPLPGELCLDLGAAPGGWTWVIAKLGARAFSLDKALLDPSVASMANVDSCVGSGFALEPGDVGKTDWLFSDMACYPERLLQTVQKWIEADAFHNAVCTIKLQGATNHAVVQAFRSIPGSQVLHLSCNKHELTWINLGSLRNSPS